MKAKSHKWPWVKRSQRQMFRAILTEVGEKEDALLDRRLRRRQAKESLRSFAKEIAGG